MAILTMPLSPSVLASIRGVKVVPPAAKPIPTEGQLWPRSSG